MQMFGQILKIARFLNSQFKIHDLLDQITILISLGPFLKSYQLSEIRLNQLVEITLCQLL